MEGPLSLQAKVSANHPVNAAARASAVLCVRWWVGARRLLGTLGRSPLYLGRKVFLTASEMSKWRCYEITHS